MHAQHRLTPTEHPGSCRYASARLWDDGVIDPADTRRVVGLALVAAMQGQSNLAPPSMPGHVAPHNRPHYGVFRM